jgi:DNA primase large subunit
MFVPEYPAVLDPFSVEAKRIIQESPPLESMPQEVLERAVSRVGWKDSREIIVNFDQREIRAEVLSFYLMCQSVAAVSHPYSREARLAGKATSAAIRYRMYDLFRRGYEDLCLQVVQKSIKLLQLGEGEKITLNGIEIPRDDLSRLRDKNLDKDGIQLPADPNILSQYTPKYAVRWGNLAPLLKHQRLELVDLYIVKGWAAIAPRELWEIFSNFISIRTEEYITGVYERFQDSGTPPRVFQEVGERISSLLPPELEVMERFAGARPGKLRPEYFPPCIEKALSGVGSGARNYAITVLLTSFLSYARASPSGKLATRMADFISDISVVRDEIIPFILKAAERCNPPFFRDQPQELANVHYHLGFGMTTEPRLEDSGKSKWYKVPNCQKIAISAPSLCNPNETCKQVKNPLTYYFRKISEGRGG